MVSGQGVDPSSSASVDDPDRDLSFRPTVIPQRDSSEGLGFEGGTVLDHRTGRVLSETEWRSTLVAVDPRGGGRLGTPV